MRVSMWEIAGQNSRKFSSMSGWVRPSALLGVTLVVLLLGAELRAEGNLEIPQSISKSAQNRIKKSAKVLEAAKQNGGKNLKRAINELNEARKRAPDCHLIPYYLGTCYQLRRNFEKAKEELAIAISLREGFTEALMRLADVHLVLGELAEAESRYDLAIEQSNYIPAYDAKVRLLIRQSRFEDARTVAGKAQTIDRNQSRGKLMRRITEAIKPSWGTTFTAKTDHYVVKTNVSDEYAAEIGRFADLIHKKFDALFSVSSDLGAAQKRPLSILVYNGKKTFPSKVNKFGGYYDKTFHTVSFHRRGDQEKTLSALFHLLFHQYASDKLSVVPYWFDEGLARYFGMHRVAKTKKGNRLYSTADHGYCEILKVLAHNKVLLAPKDMAVMTREQVDNDLLGEVLIVQAWMRWYFLLEGVAGKSSKRGGFRFKKNNTIHKAVKKYLVALKEKGHLEAAYDARGSLDSVLKKQKVEQTYRAFRQMVIRKEVGAGAPQGGLGGKVKRNIPDCVID
jgi:tetratricopeptide (TPR) repeat protein